MKNAGHRQRRHRCNGNFKQPDFRGSQRHHTRHRGRRPLQPVSPRRIRIASGLAHGALADGGVFHLGPHRMQIVRSRDHRKQQNQHASQGQQTLQRTHRSRQPHSRVAPPQPVSRQRQQHPREIEQQFHAVQSKAANGTDFAQPFPIILHEPQTQVNVTTVPANRQEPQTRAWPLNTTTATARPPPAAPPASASAPGRSRSASPLRPLRSRTPHTPHAAASRQTAASFPLCPSSTESVDTRSP